ncbi:MAG: S1C family serine protease [Ignavibacteriaceae bacterium]
MNKKLIMILSGVIILVGSVTFNAQTKTDAPLYYEANGKTSSASFQNAGNDDSITNSRKTAITETVQKVSPAVVGINVTEIKQYSSPFSNFFNDPFFRQFFGNQGTFNQKVKELGSGFIISPDGYIVTNDHVAGNASEITVTVTNGKEYKAKLIGTDQSTDICLLKIDGHNLPYVTLGNSDNVMIGEWVIAFGNPFGLFNVNDKPTVTVGVISSTGMNLEPVDNRYYLNMLQTDAAINGGNSGGPLANSLGEVIGMNTLIYTAGGNQGSIGLGFAIPINKIKKVITELKEHGKIDRNFSIGLKIQTVDEGIAKYYNLKSTHGVIVTDVIPNSPASIAGIKSGDIILQVNDYKIIDNQTLVGVFQQFRSGQTITLKLLRNNKEISKQMTLEKTVND